MSQPATPAPETLVAAPAPAPYPNKTNPLQSTKTSSWMWLSMLLGFFLMLWLTLLAVRHNPLYSDTSSGLSKYRFIEECKDLIHDEVSKETANQPGITVGFNARDLVSGVSDGYQSLPPQGSTQMPPRTAGWTLIAPMQVHRDGYPSQTATLGCHYSQGGKVELIR